MALITSRISHAAHHGRCLTRTRGLALAPALFSAWSRVPAIYYWSFFLNETTLWLIDNVPCAPACICHLWMGFACRQWAFVSTTTSGHCMSGHIALSVVVRVVAVIGVVSTAATFIGHPACVTLGSSQTVEWFFSLGIIDSNK